MTFDQVLGTDWNSHLDDRLDSLIKQHVESAAFSYSYTQADLDKHVNDEETLREYVRDTEKTFRLRKKNLESMSDLELNDYLRYLDHMWEV